MKRVRGVEAADSAAFNPLRLHRPDEVIVTSQIYDHAKRVRSYEILAEVREELKS